jgi:hypothetical protein
VQATSVGSRDLRFRVDDYLVVFEVHNDVIWVTTVRTPDEGIQLKLRAAHVSVSDFDDLYVQISFGTEALDADFDAPTKPYLLIQRQFEYDDGGVCYIETHEPDNYAGHFRLRLVEFSPGRLVFDIDRASNRKVEVTFKLAPQRFQKIQRIVRIIFGVKR